MNEPCEQEKEVRTDVSDAVPRRVRLACWLAGVGGAVVLGVASATPVWPVAGACISVAAMLALVCCCIVKYR